MSDYIFKYTSSPQTNDSFVVKPYTANGPATPTSTSLYNNSTSGVYAISANTPFVLVGKGVVDYGQAVQNNIIYLAENFCARSRPTPPLKGMLWFKSENYTDPQNPSDPTQTGLYMWNGVAWKQVLTNGSSLAVIDANGQRVINVADATTATDAVNRRYADDRYLQLAGGTMSGNVVFSAGTNITLPTPPTTDVQAANKLYVDDGDATLQNNITTVSTTLTNSLAATNAQFNLYLPLVGGTISGTLDVDGTVTIGSNGSLYLESGGSGVCDVGNRRIMNVGDTVAAYDAATKVYVDGAISDAIADAIAGLGGGGTADGVVSSGSFNATTGTLTLSRTMGLPDVTISGTLAPKTHDHVAFDVKYDIKTNKGQGVMNSRAVDLGIDLETADVSSALTMLDQAAYFSQLDPVREIQMGDGTTTSFVLDDKHAFEVWSDRLAVYINGVKQYADFRSHAEITLEDAVNGLGLNSTMTLTPGTYTQTFTVDGTPHNASVVIVAGDTYWDMIIKLAASIDTNSIPVGLLMEQLYTGIWLSFVSLNTGPTHSVALSMSAGQLFQSITYHTTPTATVGATYSYAEVGVPGDTSTSITFHAAPATGSLIEFIVQR